jgi:uncharacterized protein (TIGR03435 family)
VVDFSTAIDRPPDSMRTIGPITMSGTTLANFAVALEEFLGGSVMVEDESGLTGLFDIELRGQYDTAETLIAALRDQLGLVLTNSVQ